jgi:hypothetical protein
VTSLFSQNTSLVFSKPDYFKAISSDDLNLINIVLKTITNIPNTEKIAYEGALLMKKAGLVSGLGDKLSLFKEGRIKLEEAIDLEGENAEFRFLRIIIQENAPGFLGYNDQLETDSKYVSNHISGLDSEVKNAIRDYCKKSKFLIFHD